MTHFRAPQLQKGCNKKLLLFLILLKVFSKCRFTFCLVCGCYFRNASWGRAPLAYPACSCTRQTHKCRKSRATRPVTTAFKTFQRFSSVTGVWLRFSARSAAQPSSPTCCSTLEALPPAKHKTQARVQMLKQSKRRIPLKAQPIIIKG